MNSLVHSRGKQVSCRAHTPQTGFHRINRSNRFTMACSVRSNTWLSVQTFWTCVKRCTDATRAWMYSHTEPLKIVRELQFLRSLKNGREFVTNPVP